MKHATLDERDRVLLEAVRELLCGLAATMSLELEERLGRLEALVRERRTVVVRRRRRAER